MVGSKAIPPTSMTCTGRRVCAPRKIWRARLVCRRAQGRCINGSRELTAGHDARAVDLHWCNIFDLHSACSHHPFSIVTLRLKYYSSCIVISISSHVFFIRFSSVLIFVAALLLSLALSLISIPRSFFNLTTLASLIVAPLVLRATQRSRYSNLSFCRSRYAFWRSALLSYSRSLTIDKIPIFNRNVTIEASLLPRWHSHYAWLIIVTHPCQPSIQLRFSIEDAYISFTVRIRTKLFKRSKFI